jgi:hypothetical protein
MAVLASRKAIPTTFTKGSVQVGAVFILFVGHFVISLTKICSFVVSISTIVLIDTELGTSPISINTVVSFSPFVARRMRYVALICVSATDKTNISTPYVLAALLCAAILASLRAAILRKPTKESLLVAAL